MGLIWGKCFEVNGDVVLVIGEVIDCVCEIWVDMGLVSNSFEGWEVWVVIISKLWNRVSIGVGIEGG